MAYCTDGDVQNVFHHIEFTAISEPTTAEVNIYASQVSQVMDAKIKTLGYETPLSGTNQLVLLKNIACNGVIAMILRSVEVGSVEQPEMYQALFDNAMKDIIAMPDMLSTNATEEPVAPGSHEDSGRRHFNMGVNEW